MPTPPDHDLFLLFEHPALTDAYDAQRQSRLYGWHYRTDHSRYVALCQRLAQRWPADLATTMLAKPLHAVPDNTALCMLRTRPQGRDALPPALVGEAVPMGFTVHVDYRGRAYCPQGVCTASGLEPLPADWMR